MNAKDDILQRIRDAVPARAPGEEPAPEVPRRYQRTRTIPEGLTDRFCERVADYRAQVERVSVEDVPAAIGSALTAFGAKRVAVADGLPAPWRSPDPGWAGVEVVTDPPESPLSTADLQSLDAVVTGAALGIAETGTVVLDGTAACGRRALTLVPDTHVCIVSAASIVDDVPSAVARLRPSRPLTWISGPSATSDIELNRVEGVHGPRRLHVIVAEG